MGGNGGTDAGAFSSELAALKRRGCNVLVAGEAGRVASRAACGQLLGDEAATRRRRVVVTTGASPGLERRLAGSPAEHTTVVRRRASARGAVADRPDDSPAAPSVTVVDEDLDVLGRAALLAIDEHAVPDLEPAALRLCVDGLGPLLADHDVARVREFVEALVDRVADANGMGHVHLRVAFDHETVAALRPLFDVAVELRPGDPPEQRWHLDTADLVTDWLPLDGADSPGSADAV